jgi:hypothetical protein
VRMTDPKNVLADVAEIIEQRAKTHGDFQDNFKMTAALWSAYLEVDITASQVAVLNILQKVSRDQSSENANEDNLNDATGYAAIAAALQK